MMHWRSFEELQGLLCAGDHQDRTWWSIVAYRVRVGWLEASIAFNFGVLAWLKPVTTS